MQECKKRTLDLLERSFELEKQNILDEELEAKNNADLVALDSKIDELNRSKFESNCEKEREKIEQKKLKKRDSLDVKTLKLKKKIDHFRSSFTKNA